jgi:hypothetical protein
MRNSNPNAIPGTGLKKERGGYILHRADGTYYTIELVDPSATECTYTTPSQAPPPGDTIVAVYHTHPQLFLELMYGCPGWAQDPSDGKKPAFADPNDPSKGGGSPADWNATLQGFPIWAFTKDGHLYRLEQAYYDFRSSNPFKWVENPAAPGCFTTP